MCNAPCGRRKPIHATAGLPSRTIDCTKLFCQAADLARRPARAVNNKLNCYFIGCHGMILDMAIFLGIVLPFLALLVPYVFGPVLIVFLLICAFKVLTAFSAPPPSP
jgi:hypothetical protein